MREDIAHGYVLGVIILAHDAHIIFTAFVGAPGVVDVGSTDFTLASLVATRP